MYWKGASYWHVKGNRWTKLGKTYANALRKYAEVDQPRTQWGDLVTYTYDRLDVSKNTQAQYDLIRPRLIKAFNHLQPHEITTRHVYAMMEAYSGTPNMANRMLSVLRLVCDRGARLGAMDFNPTIGVKRFTEKKRDRYITHTEFAAILDKLSPRHRVVAEMAYLTAQRIGDVLSITRSQITAEGILFTQQKTHARLLVQMTPGLRQAIEASESAYGARKEHLYPITGKDSPMSYTAMRDAWRRAVKKAGVDHCTLHDIRAKSLTDAKKQGHDPQALAGHRLESTTVRYLRGKEVPVVVGPALEETGGP